MSAKDAIEKLDAGASLVQLYTGFVYEGPALVKRINKAILKECITNLKSRNLINLLSKVSGLFR
jgi:dihydroorotate dehydrogenase